jgi:hypothetical protein
MFKQVNSKQGEIGVSSAIILGRRPKNLTARVLYLELF